jgi:hypothetical protein
MKKIIFFPLLTIGLLTLVVLNSLSIHNFYVLSSDLVNGNGRAKDVFIGLRCGTNRLGETENVKVFNGENRLAADFAQVYFPSNQKVHDYYTKESGDPFNRPSRYAPVVHRICELTLCKLPYGWASWLHVVFQVLIFYVSVYFVLRALRLGSLFILVILVSNAVIFATPVGMSFVERGQFSIYVACAYMWLLLGLNKKKGLYLVIAAFFTMVKWTALPFVFVIFSLWLLSEWKKNHYSGITKFIHLPLMFVITFCLLLIPGFDNMESFLNGLMSQEANSHGTSLSLSLIVPRVIAKLMPLFLIVVGSMYLFKRKLFFESGSLLWCSFGFLLVTYPTKAFDYSTPCILGFLPFLIKEGAETLSFRNFFDFKNNEIIRSTMGNFILVSALIVFLSLYDYLSHQIPLPDHRFQVWTYILSFLILSILAFVKWEKIKDKLFFFP